MKLSTRIFLGYFFIVGLGAYFLLNTFVDQLKPGVRQSTEETLIDIANLLAELAKEEVKAGTISNGRFASSVNDYAERDPNARIGTIVKHENNHRIYVTDAKGIVLYDSDSLDVGKDYSRWNDVYLTLQGKYGARSTRDDPDVESSAVMHVAAPILDGGKIIGVVTVAKPNVSVQPFIELAKRRLVRGGVVLMVLSLIIGLLFTLWFARSIRRLTDYAQAVSSGARVAVPDLGKSELGTLAKSMGTMRSQLDGKEYVENYVQTMAHEMKSPLAAIKGAAELLNEDMPVAERKKFLGNISGESARLQLIIDRMLNLAAVEQQQALQDITPIPARELLETLLASKQFALNDIKLNIINKLDNSLILSGERFLLEQTFSNLLDNALDFCSSANGNGPCAITIDGAKHPDRVDITVHNTGEPIPDYALPRLFERFYSLPRPGTGKKSTGLGLAFVREVAQLHGGTITLINDPAGGVTATLSLPVV